MGAWGTDIKENDTSGDIYSEFFDLYNNGENPKDISTKLIESNQEIINNSEDCNNFWFALALAQWETKSLDINVFEKVKVIIESGDDLEIWKALDADEKDIKKRGYDLEKFLSKIQTNKQKAKPRVKEKQRNPIFATGDCLIFRHTNGNYGGVVILATDNEPGHGLNLVGGTRINQSSKPSITDFEKAEILVRNYASWKDDPIIIWTFPDSFKKGFSDFFELIGKIVIEKEYNSGDHKFGYVADWGMTKLAADSQFEHEKTYPKPEKTITISELTKNKKWWKFW